MNSRERLLTALQHREPDRVPIDLGGTDVTSICKGAYVDLMHYLGRDPGEIVLVNIVEQLPALDEAFLDDVIRADTRQVRERGGSGWVLHMEDEGDYWSYVNEWQIRLRMPKKGGQRGALLRSGGVPHQGANPRGIGSFPMARSFRSGPLGRSGRRSTAAV